MYKHFRGWGPLRFINYLYRIGPYAEERTAALRDNRPSLGMVIKQNGQRQRRLIGCAASTAPDRDGSMFSEQALSQMAVGVIGLPVLLDGKPEVYAVVGEVVEAQLAPQPTGEIDLMVIIELLFSTQEAERVWRIAGQNIAIGLDVNVIVCAEERTGDSQVILDVEIVDVSICTTPRQNRLRGLRPVQPWDV